MLISTKMEKAINDQINAEFYSAYMYLGMSAWFESENLSGFANWMYVQYQEEVSHAMKFFRYVNERGGRVVLDTIEEVESDFKSSVEVFEETLEHEKYVTNRIYDLVSLAREEKDYATESFLSWYIDEQVEEENNANSILEELKMIGDSKSSLMMLNKELATRVFVDATQQNA